MRTNQGRTGQEQVLDALSVTEPRRLDEVADRARMNKSKVANALQVLRRKGLVSPVDAVGRGDGWVRNITDGAIRD